MFFCKLSIAYPTLSRPMILSMSVKNMNDTLCPEGIIPSALVLREFPLLRSSGDFVIPRPYMAARASATTQACEYMDKNMARLRVQRALRHKVPPAANVSYQYGEQVSVWRERLIAQRIGEWKGPCEVLSVEEDKKLAQIRLDGDPRPLNVYQTKKYLSPSIASSNFIHSLSQSLQTLRSTTSTYRDTLDQTPVHIIVVLYHKYLRC